MTDQEFIIENKQSGALLKIHFTNNIDNNRNLYDAFKIIQKIYELRTRYVRIQQIMKDQKFEDQPKQFDSYFKKKCRQDFLLLDWNMPIIIIDIFYRYISNQLEDHQEYIVKLDYLFNQRYNQAKEFAEVRL